jgi:molybdate transport system substrate-binding protein
MRKWAANIILCLVLTVLGVESQAQDKILVAVATNFIEPFKEIAGRFQTGSDIQVEPTFASTGKLYAQITQGAPYDLFLSADEKRPQELFQKGLAEKPFVYATGEVILWTSRRDLCTIGSWKAVLARGDVKRVSIANIETAPYGTSAMTALKNAGIWEGLQAKLVFPQDVAQSFQYAVTGSVDVGFCALSSALSEQGRSGCYLEVKDAPEVIQAACVLKRGVRKDAAERFAAFLLSPEASTIKRKYGYK